MTVAVQATIDEAAAIEVALDKLLTAVTDHLDRPREPGPRDFKTFSMADIMAAFDAEQAMTKAQRRSKDLLEGVDGPVGEALRLAIRAFGERLHEIGGTKLMGDVLDRLAEKDPRNEGRRTDIMDKRWDGIGSWVA